MRVVGYGTRSITTEAIERIRGAYRFGPSVVVDNNNNNSFNDDNDFE